MTNNNITEEMIETVPFQARVQPWMMECFGPEIAADKLERNDRFIEEALELVQASGYDKARAHALVDYTFDRPQGEINQEVGGVMVTLAAHCLAHGIDMHKAGETELARIWTKVEQIRAKQATKPTGSALPVAASQPPVTMDGLVERVAEAIWPDPWDDMEFATADKRHRENCKNQARRQANAAIEAAGIPTLLATIERQREALKLARRETCISNSNGVDFKRTARMTALRAKIDVALESQP